MNRPSTLGAAIGCALVVAGGVAGAAPALRAQVDQRGDFVLIGNTLGHDCRAGIPAPLVGTVGPCGPNTEDSSADVFWRADHPAPGQATASTSMALGDARSTAILSLPDGAAVTHAWLYWGARTSASSADTSVTLDCPGGFAEDVTAFASFTAPAGGGEVHYQSVADVTAIVQSAGAGAYRVAGVDSLALPTLDEHVAFSGWYMVVFYERGSEPPRNLALFDGLDRVDVGTSQAATLSGFLVPLAGFDAKLAVIAFEGDFDVGGDALRFGTAPLSNADRLSDAQNPSDDFFNGTRSALGNPVSFAGDLPRLTGGAGSLSGMDLDVLDIGSRVAAGQTSADIEATSSGDVYLLASFVTSVSTFAPDFSSSSKSVVDENGGPARPGDVLTYTIVVTNTGDDTAVETVLSDPLPVGVTYVPGSIRIVSGANAGEKTDPSGDDQAEYSAANRTLTVRLGSGAGASSGGELVPGQSTTVAFSVTLDADAPSAIANQATITSAGKRGAPPRTTPTDGNAEAPGSQPTEVEPRAAGGGIATGGELGIDGTLRGGGSCCAAPRARRTPIALAAVMLSILVFRRSRR